MHPPSPACYCDCACSWSLSSLIGSYLDLALAYLLLIGSTLAFFASKFLSVFGLALPCPCDARPPHYCLRSRIGSIHSSIQTRFPFATLANQPGNNNQRPPAVAHIGSGPEENADADDVDGFVVRNPAAPVNAARRIRRRRRKGKASSAPPLHLSWQGEEEPDPSFDIASKSKEPVDEVDDNRTIVDDPLVDEEAPPSNAVYDAPSAAGDVQTALHSNGYLELIVRNLERELEEAQSSHAALYQDLEKERSAAASAADEAMAMILRLQSEKATLEMASRQYQRMIEEKSAFDEEEMDILKEIIVRRELENHVLEKELEGYRRVMVPGDILGKELDYSFDLSDDPAVMNWVAESNVVYREKGMVADEVYPSQQHQGSNNLEDASRIDSEDEERMSKIDMRRQDGDQRGSEYSLSETELRVLDVHVIGDKCDSSFQERDAEGSTSEVSTQGRREDEFLIAGDTDVSATTPLPSRVGVERDIHGSFSDIAKGRELVRDSSGSASEFELRRRSMSAVSSERNKLETEVEVLRKRLKAIQQGRENLSFCVAYKEKEASQLQLLDEITCQLQEIRKLTEPGSSMRRASLPPLSSKVTLCH